MILFFAIFLFVLSFIVLVGTIYWAFCQKKQAYLEEYLPIYNKPVEYYCINLDKRPYKYEKLKEQIKELKKFKAIDGKLLDLDLVDERIFKKSFIKHIKNNETHKGHLGASFSHYNMLNEIVDNNNNSLYVIFEDDVILEKDWKEKALNAIERLELIDRNWDIFLLGFNCDYNHTGECHQNDNSPILLDQIVKINYFVGLWGYVINGKRAATKLKKEAFPASWMVDIEYGRLAKDKKINVYGTIPNIAFHPGHLKISSFNYEYNKPAINYYSDTNN